MKFICPLLVYLRCMLIAYIDIRSWSDFFEAQNIRISCIIRLQGFVTKTTMAQIFTIALHPVKETTPFYFFWVFQRVNMEKFK